MSAASDNIRVNFKKSDEERNQGLVTPKTVERFDNILYGTDKTWQILDVYRPREAKRDDGGGGQEKGKLPVIISVHGGAWVYGTKEVYQYYCMDLARRGFAVINFNYRLAPEHKFPAPLEDTNLVVRWMLLHAEEYGFDKDHVFFVGDSAGGHGLSLYAAVCTNGAYQREYPFEIPEGFRPTGIALNCGIYKIETIDHHQTKELMSDYLPEGGTEEELDFVNVLSYITPDYPPTFIMTANEDFLQSQAPLLVEKLMEENVPFAYHFYGTKKQPLPHVFQCDIRLSEAALCNDEECGFFRRFC